MATKAMGISHPPPGALIHQFSEDSRPELEDLYLDLLRFRVPWSSPALLRHIVDVRARANSKESHLKAVKQILRYLKGTLDLCIWYPSGYSFDLVGYVDVGAGFYVDRKSTSGTTNFLCSCLVSWGTKKQNSVALSIADAKYVKQVATKELVLRLSWKDEDNDRGKKEEEAVDNHEENNAENKANEEEKSEHEGESRDEKESDMDDKIGEQVNDFAEGDNHSEEEDNFESVGEDQEKISKSEGVDEESEEENENMSPSEETGEEKETQEPGPLLTPFTGDEVVSSDEDDLSLSEAGKKPRKTLVKATKSIVLTSKRKAIDEQIIKESRSVKKPRKNVSIVKPMVELDGEDESESDLPTKSST
ncbi:PREDICTED: RNA polymerase-associated protein LEO1-like [Nicotiana attenuata]|uniref:RNA polymerase-associated protein LEO1-like n=1 Tax=Nicotiana attenuata TaxID=49451 RepID=UPI000904CFC0|nr:PREDICTED: RNA polymerase-associated protein LEO1-like [Nicotiana attenuata]